MCDFEFFPRSVKEIFDILGAIALIGSLLYLKRADDLAKLTAQVRIVTNCLKRFSKLAPRIFDLTALNEGQRKLLLYEYFLLVEEEMLYIKNESIPLATANQWVFGMIETLSRFHTLSPGNYQQVLLEIYSPSIGIVFTPERLIPDPEGRTVSEIIELIKAQ